MRISDIMLSLRDLYDITAAITILILLVILIIKADDYKKYRLLDDELSEFNACKIMIIRINNWRHIKRVKEGEQVTLNITCRQEVSKFGVRSLQKKFQNFELDADSSIRIAQLFKSGSDYDPDLRGIDTLTYHFRKYCAKAVFMAVLNHRDIHLMFWPNSSPLNTEDFQNLRYIKSHLAKNLAWIL